MKIQERKAKYMRTTLPHVLIYDCKHSTGYEENSGTGSTTPVKGGFDKTLTPG